MIVNIDGKDGLVRDISSGAILNTNRTDYENYMNQKSQKEAQKLKETEREQEINMLKSEITEIKQMLVSLLHKYPKE
jgi:hypothetical protein